MKTSSTTETSERGVGRWPRAGALFVVQVRLIESTCSIGTAMLPPIVVSYVYDPRTDTSARNVSSATMSVLRGRPLQDRVRVVVVPLVVLHSVHVRPEPGRPRDRIELGDVAEHDQPLTLVCIGHFAITAHSREVIERAGSGGSSCRVSRTLSPGI